MTIIDCYRYVMAYVRITKQFAQIYEELMEKEQGLFRQVAVLGSGVMGAQIAAHLANAGIPVRLYDLADTTSDKLLLLKRALKTLTTLKPPPLASPALIEHIQIGTYDAHLTSLKSCDLVIEAVSERYPVKQALYEKIHPHLHENAIFASNTSGLSINHLAECLPPSLRTRFCGIHFFNPPRYMSLVELIPTADINPQLLDVLETFLVMNLGKGVVRAKDTPCFIANRIGVFSVLSILKHAQYFELTPEIVDVLTGVNIGRPKSATYRMMDIIGLDTIQYVLNTLSEQLPNDPWHEYFQLPDWLQDLIAQGALGQKTGKGIYHKKEGLIQVYDPSSRTYREPNILIDSDIKRILKEKSIANRFQQLRASSRPQARFLWAIFRDLFHYSAYHLEDIAETVRDVDLALRWGFAWQMGVFELWQTIGWNEIRTWIEADRHADKKASPIALPEWVNDVDAVYSPQGAFSPAKKQVLKRSTLAVYQRQVAPERVLAEESMQAYTVWENEDARLWHMKDDLLILSFKTPLNTINEGVLDAIFEGVRLAEEHFSALILWQLDSTIFSAGANLKDLIPLLPKNDKPGILRIIEKFQRAANALRYSLIPTIAAIRGKALGGGCELAMHCDLRVAALESYPGLVEVAIGVLPAGGGLKEFARRIWNGSKTSDPFPTLMRYFTTIAKGEVANSALDAKEKGYFHANDVIVMNNHEVLHVAKQHAKALAASAYRPPIKETIGVMGEAGLARLQMHLVNYWKANFISDYDYEITREIATVICGGALAYNTRVPEEWFLRMERETFAKLAIHPLTQARIQHMLETGKPLRN
jgi:3-hydroxyacyl-CoA dehydrogenase